MPDLEQRISVTGGQQSAAEINQVADATKHVAEATDHAGEKGRKAAKGFEEFGYSAQGLGQQITGLAQSMFGMDALFNLASKLLDKLERIAEVRRELADASTGSLETALPLAEQRGDVSQKGLEGALRDATELRKQALMPSLAAATALATAADIKLPGGFNPAKDADAFKRNLAIASAVGGALPTGTPETYGAIFEVMSAAGITDPQQIKAAMAKALAVQAKSDSKSPGAFMAGLNTTGMKAFLSGGGSVEDAATILAQARAATGDDAQAATAADVLLRNARGTNQTRPFLEKKAKEFGYGKFDTLTDTQRFQLLEQAFAQAEAGGPAGMAKFWQQGFEPGQVPILQGALSAKARGMAGEAHQAARQVSAATVDAKIRDFSGNQIAEERRQQADAEYNRAVLGIDVFSISKLREKAAERNKLRLARRDVTEGELAEASTSSEEALVEREAMNILVERALELQSHGVDVSGVWGAINRARTGGFMPIGVSDRLLDRANEAVNAAVKQATGGAGGGAPVTVNVTNIGTHFGQVMPGTITDPPPDLNE